eukprot:TRINITY_DN4942_c0_g2_i12.p2 TRINITY_DN4942_c0_g2~~TRINITY_DN4942_c0_g2_i12.p2  ORF type:complete len:116 (+),score=16.56 TRINITY_DN4942_c0_g2_i12:71-418(+)
MRKNCIFGGGGGGGSGGGGSGSDGGGVAQLYLLCLCPLRKQSHSKRVVPHVQVLMYCIIPVGPSPPSINPGLHWLRCTLRSSHKTIGIITSHVMGSSLMTIPCVCFFFPKMFTKN